MEREKRSLKPEDYAEPGCLLCDGPYGTVPGVRPIPLRRVAERLERYLEHRDAAGVERHLLYWLEEARLGHDLRGELYLSNELVGHYRKQQDRERSLRYAARAQELIGALGLEGSVTAGTTLINAATACTAFGEHERALELFERARAAYGSQEDVGPELLGGLCNNMAVTCRALGRYAEAMALYEQALAQMERSGGLLEQAITCLNMADVITEEQGPEAGEARIAELLERAWALLTDPSVPRDGHYAFVCDKCRHSFAYHGWFAAAEELRAAAEGTDARA